MMKVAILTLLLAATMAVPSTDRFLIVPNGGYGFIVSLGYDVRHLKLYFDGDQFYAPMRMADTFKAALDSFYAAGHPPLDTVELEVNIYGRPIFDQ